MKTQIKDLGRSDKQDRRRKLCYSENIHKRTWASYEGFGTRSKAKTVLNIPELQVIPDDATGELKQHIEAKNKEEVNDYYAKLIVVYKKFISIRRTENQERITLAWHK